MARKKLKLAWIQNASARRNTLKKRKQGLIKKVYQLSTLCGVDACAIIYAPDESQPEVWPCPTEAERVLERFRSMTGVEKSKKMMNQEDFLLQGILKLKQQVEKMQRENREYEIRELVFGCLMGSGLPVLGTGELIDMAWWIDRKSKEIEDRIRKLREMTSAVEAVSENKMITSSQTTFDLRLFPMQSTSSHAQQQQLLQLLQQQQQQQQQHLQVQQLQLQLQQQQQEHQQQHHQQLTVYYGGGEDDLHMPYGDNAPWYNLYSP